MVDFKQPWLQLTIQHDVKAEELIAYVRVSWLTALVIVLQLRL